ncbi:hypothetical protein [Gloeocapsopsis dulcis]|uniref:Uncharacterized protein n=1 Tax=Gloeocapsopsis dulcis AAB1 = 1H9 TaxID=1433147 RepID=A0A6N8FSF7_9CHRO|nr:hypothetical protein [Gloeocapsopsis dulcis]MUL36068.1 hypothetical protein [Gloeocapsopsis dulcis AAB1 = 1H9]WNN91461.1 hypothetical protein P0S91_10475 [Gloeocapsopsis dulcis]
MTEPISIPQDNNSNAADVRATDIEYPIEALIEMAIASFLDLEALGFADCKLPIHIQCSYPARPLIKIITVYEPGLRRWKDDFTQRRHSNDD